MDLERIKEALQGAKATLQGELAWFLPELRKFWEKVREAPRLIREGTAGQSILSDRLFAILLQVLLVLGAISLLHSFFKARWKGKLLILAVIVGIVLFLLLLLYFSLRQPTVMAAALKPL